MYTYTHILLIQIYIERVKCTKNKYVLNTIDLKTKYEAEKSKRTGV